MLDVNALVSETERLLRRTLGEDINYSEVRHAVDKHRKCDQPEAVPRDETDDSRAARMAKNEASARKENESRSAWFHGHERVTFVCECADPNCSETLSFDREMYESLRESPTRFAVAVNHDQSIIERVVKRHRHCWVVEKIGDAAEVAKESAETTEVLRRPGEAPEVLKETVETEVTTKPEGDRPTPS